MSSFFTKQPMSTINYSDFGEIYLQACSRNNLFGIAGKMWRLNHNCFFLEKLPVVIAWENVCWISESEVFFCWKWFFFATMSNEFQKVRGCVGYISTQLCVDCFINHEIRISSFKQPGFNWKYLSLFCFFVAHIVSILFRWFTMFDFNLDWFESINWVGGCTPSRSFWEKLASTLFLMSTWNIVPQQGCPNDRETDPTYHEWSIRILSFQNMQEYYTWRVLVHSQKVMIVACKGV